MDGWIDGQTRQGKGDDDDEQIATGYAFKRLKVYLLNVLFFLLRSLV